MEKKTLQERIFPEVTYFEILEERRKAWALATKLPRGGLLAYCVILVVVLAVAPPMAQFLLLSLPGVDEVPPVFNGVVVALIVVPAPMVTAWIFRRKVQRSLRQQLTERGRPICLECGYDLRGQTVSRCPECGTAFDEKLLKDAEAPPSMQDCADS